MAILISHKYGMLQETNHLSQTDHSAHRLEEQHKVMAQVTFTVNTYLSIQLFITQRNCAHTTFVTNNNRQMSSTIMENKIKISVKGGISAASKL
jgi:hypothetical protein